MCCDCRIQNETETCHGAADNFHTNPQKSNTARPQQQTAATPSAVIWHSASYGATASSATEGPLAAGVTLDELRLEMNDLVQVADNLVRR